MKDFLETWVYPILGFVLVIAFAIVLVESFKYNSDMSDLCESRGLSMVRDFNTGKYGCGTVTSIKEYES